MKGFFRRDEIPTTKQQTKQPTCGACGLWKTCKSSRIPVSGEGKKKIFVLGECPDEKEDRTGKSFTGKPNVFLRRQLKKQGIALTEDCWKMNAVCCMPPDKRSPEDSEILSCRPLVLKQIEKLQPEIIILLGITAVKSVLAHRWKKGIGGIAKWRGWSIPDRNLNAWLYPLFDPKYVTRMENSAVPTIFSNDLSSLSSKIDIPFPEFSDEDKCIQILNTKEEVEEYLLNVLRYTPKFLAFDFETTGLKPHKKGHKIASVSMCWQKDLAASWLWKNTPIDTWRKVMENPKIGKMAANMKMEDTWSIVRGRGIKVQGWVWDTMQAAHILDNRKGITSLKFDVYKRYGVIDYDSDISHYLTSTSEEFGANGFNRVFEAPVDKLLLYGAKDSLFTYRIAGDQMREMGLI